MTTVDNPFVVYENRRIDEHGYLLFSDELLKDPADKTLAGESKGGSKAARHTFRNTDIHRSVEGPLDSMRTGTDLEKRTLKIEVTY